MPKRRHAITLSQTKRTRNPKAARLRNAVRIGSLSLTDTADQYECVCDPLAICSSPAHTDRSPSQIPPRGPA